MTGDARRAIEQGLVGDGPIIPVLHRLGLDRAQPIETAVLSHPRLVAQAFGAYIDAGAAVVCTPTTGANRWLLEARGLAEQAEDLNRSAAAVARGAADAAAHPVAVAGQIGPSGRYLRIGELSETALREGFAAQAAWLVRGGADVLLLSRFLDLDELLIAVSAARQAVDRPVIAALVFDSGAERVDTPAGQSPALAAQQLDAAGADVIGCDAAPPETALSILGLLLEHGRRPAFIRTTAGSPELEEGRVVYSESPAAFAVRAAELRRRGAAVVAGCAGTTPDHIGALSAAWPKSIPRRPRR
jgi:methionine synthase I (cobalamin-dependent)